MNDLLKKLAEKYDSKTADNIRDKQFNTKYDSKHQQALYRLLEKNTGEQLERYYEQRSKIFERYINLYHKIK